MTKLYGGIDLHANNGVIVLVDDQEQVVYEQRTPNDLSRFFLNSVLFNHAFMASSWNPPWYWLVDGLMDAGYAVHLANTAAIHQYDGLKHTNDYSDARW